MITQETKCSVSGAEAGKMQAGHLLTAPVTLSWRVWNTTRPLPNIGGLQHATSTLCMQQSSRLTCQQPSHLSHMSSDDDTESDTHRDSASGEEWGQLEPMKGQGSHHDPDDEFMFEWLQHFKTAVKLVISIIVSAFLFYFMSCGSFIYLSNYIFISSSPFCLGRCVLVCVSNF